MKRTLALLLAALMCIFTFTGCDWFKKPGNVTEDPSDDYTQRLEESEKFIEDFENFLKTDESYRSTPEEIAKKYDSVNEVEVVNNTVDSSFRIYWVMGDPTLYGNLEKEWTFLQWKDGVDICVKALEVKSGKKARSAIINKNNIAIIGYDNLNSGKSIYISLFEVSGKEVKDKKQSSELTHEKYDFELDENDVYVSSILLKDIYFENQGTGFRIYDNNSEVVISYGSELSIR